jgi:hypothetical protein
MKLYIIFLILLLLLFFNLNLKEHLMTQEEIEELNQKILFNEKIRLLREESIRKMSQSQNEQKFNYLNEDKPTPYLTEYKCLDYEDIRI